MNDNSRLLIDPVDRMKANYQAYKADLEANRMIELIKS